MTFGELALCNDDFCTDTTTYSAVASCADPLDNTFSTARFDAANGWIVDICAIDSDNDEEAGAPFSSETVVVRFSATLDDAALLTDALIVNPRDSVSVSASVTWTNTPTNTERTSPASDSASVSVRSMDGSAEVVSSSKAETTNARLTVGETGVVEYTIEVPEGETDLEFDQDISALPRVIYDTATAVTISRGSNTQFPACIESATAVPSGSTLTIEWSDASGCQMQNPADGDSSNDSFTVRVSYLIPNVPQNESRGSFFLPFDLMSTGVEANETVSLNSERIRVVLPDIVLTESFSQATGLDGESETDLTLEVRQGNSANRNGPLYDVDARIFLPKSFFTLSVGSIAGTITGGASVTCTVSDGGTDWQIDCVDLFTVANNQSRSVTFEDVQIADTVPVPSRVLSNAIVGGTTCSGGAGLNYPIADEEWTDDVTAESRAPSLSLALVETSQMDTSGANLLIGESATLRATLSVPPGVANDAALVYDLPAGDLF
ncbi:MAG: hypothetical protein AAFY60_13865, partial [Myxococcota bacterium]